LASKETWHVYPIGTTLGPRIPRAAAAEARFEAFTAEFTARLGKAVNALIFAYGDRITI
jgi:hypothetical protein